MLGEEHIKNPNRGQVSWFSVYEVLCAHTCKPCQELLALTTLQGKHDVGLLCSPISGIVISVNCVSGLSLLIRQNKWPSFSLAVKLMCVMACLILARIPCRPSWGNEISLRIEQHRVSLLFPECQPFFKNKCFWDWCILLVNLQASEMIIYAYFGERGFANFLTWL